MDKLKTVYLIWAKHVEQNSIKTSNLNVNFITTYKYIEGA